MTDRKRWWAVSGVWFAGAVALTAVGVACDATKAEASDDRSLLFSGSDPAVSCTAVGTPSASERYCLVCIATVGGVRCHKVDL